MKIFFTAFILAIAMNIQAADHPALKFVPGGVIVQEKNDEVKIKTPQGSIVEVEFSRNGAMKEASGSNIEKDIFIPESSLMNLKDAVESLKKQGKSPVGEWELERKLVNGWRYKFEGYENGQKMDYAIDAKNGKLIKSKID